MKINPEEISHIEDAGELDGSPVKLIRTKGGFWIATGRPMGRGVDQALSAGSHPAIVKYNVEKMYGNFRPSMMKSAIFSEESFVLEHGRFLSEDLRKSGHNIFSIQTGNRIEFQVTHQGVKVAEAKALLKNENIEVQDLNFKSEHVQALAGAVSEKAMILNVGVRLK